MDFNGRMDLQYTSQRAPPYVRVPLLVRYGAQNTAVPPPPPPNLFFLFTFFRLNQRRQNEFE